MPCRPHDEDILFYSIRRAAKVLPPLAGPGVELDVPIASQVHLMTGIVSLQDLIPKANRSHSDQSARLIADDSFTGLPFGVSTCACRLQGDEALLGAVDSVEAGEVWGWACLRGAPAEPVQVR